MANKKTIPVGMELPVGTAVRLSTAQRELVGVRPGDPVYLTFMVPSSKATRLIVLLDDLRKLLASDALPTTGTPATGEDSAAGLLPQRRGQRFARERKG